MNLEGGCHCGNIRFTLHWTPEPGRIPARACDCTFCRKHGGVWTSCPTGTLEVRVRDGRLMHLYAFGTKTADFHVCAACGVVPVVSCEIDGTRYAVVSVNALEGVEPALLDHAPVSFDGEGTDDRLARRRRNWIRSVRFHAAGTAA